MLKSLGIDTKNLDVEKLRSDYNTLYSKKTELQKTYKSAEKEYSALTRKLDNLNQYINRNPTQILINSNKEIDSPYSLWLPIKKVYRIEIILLSSDTLIFGFLYIQKNLA